jgi:hypothetical protein
LTSRKSIVDPFMSKNGVWISDPYVSECGRFKVNPIKHYGFRFVKAFLSPIWEEIKLITKS